MDFVPIIITATQLRLVAWGTSRGNSGIHTGVEWAPLLPLTGRVAAEDEAMSIGEWVARKRKATW